MTDLSESHPSKETLELRKIELEIQQLNKPWYVKPGYLAGNIQHTQ